MHVAYVINHNKTRKTKNENTHSSRDHPRGNAWHDSWQPGGIHQVPGVQEAKLGVKAAQISDEKSEEELKALKLKVDEMKADNTENSVDVFPVAEDGTPIIWDYQIRGFFKDSMKALKDMTKEEKVIACYQHACLLYENNLNLTNQAVRERFGLDKNKSSVASRIIADTVERGLLKVSDEQNTSTKYVSYIPFYG